MKVIPFGDAQKLREQDQAVFAMRLRGASTRETAEALALSKAEVDASMRRMVVELTPSLRSDLVSLEMERLDAMLAARMDRAIKGDDGAAEMVLKMMERRAKLLGLDAPVKTVAVVKAEERPEDERTPADKMLRKLQEVAGSSDGPIIEGEIVS